MRRPDYERSVFINCPFDEEFAPLFQAAVFTVIDLGFHVRSARDTVDGSQVRIQKLYEIIRASRLGIHDLSRTQPDPMHGLPRFNMPLELGIFLGAKYLGDEIQRRKQCLITADRRYEYQKYISDVAGQDVVPHDNDPKHFVGAVRDWLASLLPGHVPSASQIWDRYQRFSSELVETSRELKQKPQELTHRDYVKHVDVFCASKDDELIVGDVGVIRNPSRRAIEEAISTLDAGPDSFVILGKSGSGLTYMQAAGSPKEGFVLEFQQGSTDEHYRSTNDALAAPDVIRAFCLYSEADHSWRQQFQWERIDI